MTAGFLLLGRENQQAHIWRKPFRNGPGIEYGYRFDARLTDRMMRRVNELFIAQEVYRVTSCSAAWMDPV